MSSREGEWGQGCSSPRLGIKLTTAKLANEAFSYFFSSPRPGFGHRTTHPQTVTVPGWSDLSDSVQVMTACANVGDRTAICSLPPAPRDELLDATV